MYTCQYHCPQKDKFLEENLYGDIIIDTSCKVLFRLNNLLHEFLVSAQMAKLSSFLLLVSELLSQRRIRQCSSSLSVRVGIIIIMSSHGTIRLRNLALVISISAGFIDLMAWLGLAYDLKSPSAETRNITRVKVVQLISRKNMRDRTFIFEINTNLIIIKETNVGTR